MDSKRNVADDDNGENVQEEKKREILSNNNSEDQRQNGVSDSRRSVFESKNADETNQGIQSKRNVFESEETNKQPKRDITRDDDCTTIPRLVKETFCIFPDYCFPVTFIKEDVHCGGME